MTLYRAPPRRGIVSPARGTTVVVAAALCLLLLAPALALAQDGPADIPPPPPMDESAPRGEVEPFDAEAIEDAARQQNLDPGLVPPTLDDLSREQALLERAEITLIQRGDERLREYRVEGQLILIEVIPDAGPSYYLIDTNGDGQFDTRRDDLGTGFVAPRWILFRW